MEKAVRWGLNRMALAITGLVIACAPGQNGAGDATPEPPSQGSPAGSPQGTPPDSTQGTPPEPQPEVPAPSHTCPYSLATDGVTYEAGAPIKVAWSAPAGRLEGDWVGLYKVGDTDAAYLSKQDVPKGSVGMLTFSAPPRSGNYELRYLTPGTATRVGVSNSCSVSATPGNIFLFSNYEGGTYTLVVDQNLPNIQIGIVAYEPSHVTVTGPYASNVSVVRLVSYKSSESTVEGVASSKVQIVSPEAVTHKQPYGGSRIICATGQRFLSWPGGGCNSTTQVEEYFMAKFGEVSVLSHVSRYGVFSGSIPLSQARLSMVVVREVSHFDVAAAAGRPTGTVEITLEVNAKVRALTTLAPALTTGSLGSGSIVRINNYASILGAGGAGGSGGNGGGGGRPRTCSRDGLPGGVAIELTVPATINNQGNIWGGGGGGGGGSGCNLNAGGGGGAGDVGGAGGAGASQLSNEEELAFCGQDNGARSGVPGGAGGAMGGEGGKGGDYWGDGSYAMLGGDGGGYGQPGQPSGACVFASSGGAAGSAIKRNGHTVNVPDGVYDTGGGRIRGPVTP